MIIEDKSDPRKPILLINEINEESAREYTEKLYRRLKDAPILDPLVDKCRAALERRKSKWALMKLPLWRVIRREENYRKYLEYTHGVKL